MCVRQDSSEAGNDVRINAVSPEVAERIHDASPRSAGADDMTRAGVSESNDLATHDHAPTRAVSPQVALCRYLSAQAQPIGCRRAAGDYPDATATRDGGLHTHGVG